MGAILRNAAVCQEAVKQYRAATAAHLPGELPHQAAILDLIQDAVRLEAGELDAACSKAFAAFEAAQAHSAACGHKPHATLRASRAVGVYCALRATQVARERRAKAESQGFA